MNIFDGNAITATRVAHLHGRTHPPEIVGSSQIMVMQFTTDGSVAHDGFSASFTCGARAPPPTPETADPCSEGRHIADGGPVSRTGGHGNGEDCRWILSCTDNSQFPTVSFNSFDTEANFDFVNVYDGDDITAPRLAHLHGLSIPDPVTGSSATMVVQFRSDGSVIRDGFDATFTCGGGAPPPSPETADPCSYGRELTGSGEVEMNGHGNGEDCRWTLHCSIGQRPTITFSSFDTEDNYDFVNIYDGDDINAPAMSHLHGTSIPRPVTASGSAMVVQFTSDGSVTRDGFHASFSCGHAAATPPPPPPPTSDAELCSAVQLGIYNICVDDCDTCASRMDTYTYVVADCRLIVGGRAIDSMYSMCDFSTTSAPPAPPPPSSGGDLCVMTSEGPSMRICGSITQTSTNDVGTTYRLGIVLNNQPNAANAYTIFGEDGVRCIPVVHASGGDGGAGSPQVKVAWNPSRVTEPSVTNCTTMTEPVPVT
eukprot:SAG31_NODE_5368_length_2582_cov_2.264599_2_plen_481_part_01